MADKMVVIDTSILVRWLKVPGLEPAGPQHDKWDHERIETLLNQLQEEGAVFVLPLATIIESGI